MKNIKLLLAIFGLIFAFTFSASAQSITFTSIEGEKIDLEAQKGKVVVLAIGAQWLPLSNQQAVYINKLAKKYAGSDVVFYFISADSTSPKSKNYASDEDLRKFAVTNKLTISILRDSEGSTTLKRFKIDQLPSFVILDKTGKLAAAPFSGIDPKGDISVKISQEIDKVL
ncbi:MAG: TlpA family protein disulfide reductase [Acidobacteria bacterium]|jgi:peroxiredoxin|nr:TlpA family protein disulfide reductase [Acidobacteriota bacterium]